MVALADELSIMMVESPCSMFGASGILYNNGLKPLF
jgi:hypothetical protein